MKAVRWYDANVDAVKLRRVADAMLRDEYRTSRSWGFRIAERRRDSVEGAYYERVDRVEAVTDPFGKTLEYERTEFRVVAFLVSIESPSIEVTNQPRSMGDFFARIAAYASYDIAISSMRCDVGRWLAEIQSSTSAEILGLEVADVAVAAHAKGTLRIDGTADIRAATEKIVGRRAHRFSRATVRWRDGGAETVCEIQDVGRARVKRGDTSKAFRVLRAGLAAATSR